MHVMINNETYSVVKMEVSLEKIKVVIFYPVEELVPSIGDEMVVSICGEDGKPISSYTTKLSCFCLDPQSSTWTSRQHETRLVFEGE